MQRKDVNIVEAEISRELTTAGVRMSLAGFRYLKYAVALIIEDDSYMTNVCKGLYPKIAHKYGTTASRVERAMRHATSQTGVKTTNKEFISMVVEKIMVLKELPTVAPGRRGNDAGCVICDSCEIEKLLILRHGNDEYLAFVGGNSQFPKENHASFCPKCGRKLEG